MKHELNEKNGILIKIAIYLCYSYYFLSELLSVYVIYIIFSVICYWIHAGGDTCGHFAIIVSQDDETYSNFYLRF